MKKEQIRNRRDTSNEDYLANRVMAVFAAAILMLVGLTYLWNAYDVAGTFFAAIRINSILIWVSLAGVAGGLFWLVSDIKRDRLKKAAVLNGAMATLLFFVLLCSLLLIKYNYIIAKRVLYIVIPGIAILHLIYCSYQREFFSLCLTHSAVCLGVWIMAKTSSNGLAAASAAGAIAVCLAAILVFCAAKGSEGFLKLGRLRIRVFDNKNISSRTVYAIYGVTALLTAAAWLLKAPYAYYILYALAAFLIVEAVYFTVKLI